MKNKNSNSSLALIWFGASISIAEIMTGCAIAPIGFEKGMAAILLGHLIGFVLMFLTGVIGSERSESSMQTLSVSFGSRGSRFFSVLNVLQLVGWTAVMIDSGADFAAGAIGFGNKWILIAIIAALIALWTVIGSRALNIINTVAMTALFILTVILSIIVFNSANPGSLSDSSLSFGAALELSVAMPLSWLPLISDYTRNSKHRFTPSLVSSGVYFVGSSWMYIIGMSAAIFARESDITAIMSRAGLGISALIIVIFSTVTTTYLDVYSAGVSASNIFAKIGEKTYSLITLFAGFLIAGFMRASGLESFLYLIGSVFSPMVAILISDHFILKKDASDRSVSVLNFAIWFFGVVIYRIFIGIETPLGSTLPAMLIVCAVTVTCDLFKRSLIKSRKKQDL